eukprot:Skav213585  [mRNA]  locus=scaffold1790:279652:282211:- [translate_table: standard]
MEGGVLDPAQKYYLSPLSFLCQVLWLELWLRVAAPHGDDQAKLPRRFRQAPEIDGRSTPLSSINRADDMIEGEMFKHLTVKEEDKEADEEVLRAPAAPGDAIMGVVPVINESCGIVQIDVH